MLQTPRPAGNICVWAQKEVPKLLDDLMLPIFPISSVCIGGLCPQSLSVLIPWMTVGGWWVQLGWASFLCRHLNAQPLYARHFWHKTSWEMSLFLSREHRGTIVGGFSQIFHCCKYSQAHLTTWDTNFLLYTHLNSLFTLRELTSQSKTIQPAEEASCNQEPSGCY